MKKLFFGLVATVLFSVSAMANNEVVNNDKVVKENVKVGKTIKVSLGDVSNLSEAEINSLIENIQIPTSIEDDCKWQAVISYENHHIYLFGYYIGVYIEVIITYECC